MNFMIELINEDRDISPEWDFILGRLYIGEESIWIRSNGLLAYYCDQWIELWLKLGRCEIKNREILERVLWRSSVVEVATYANM